MIVLDLGLPDVSGIDVPAGLRGWLTAPVNVPFARTDSSEDRSPLMPDPTTTSPNPLAWTSFRQRSGPPCAEPPQPRFQQ